MSLGLRGLLIRLSDLRVQVYESGIMGYSIDSPPGMIMFRVADFGFRIEGFGL